MIDNIADAVYTETNDPSATGAVFFRKKWWIPTLDKHTLSYTMLKVMECFETIEAKVREEVKEEMKKADLA